MAEQGGRIAVLSPEGGPLRMLDGRYSDGAARLEELDRATTARRSGCPASAANHSRSAGWR